jgi:hypothetical protein
MMARLMGRWRNRSPTMLSPDEPALCTQDGRNFGYVEQNDSSPFQDATAASTLLFLRTRVLLIQKRGSLCHRRLIGSAAHYPAGDGIRAGRLGATFGCG